MTLRRVDFYARKGTVLPRFICRNVATALRAAQSGQARTDIINEFLDVLNQRTSEGHFLKFKWVLPTSFSEMLTVSERAQAEARLAEIRAKCTWRLFEV